MYKVKVITSTTNMQKAMDYALDGINKEGGVIISTTSDEYYCHIFYEVPEAR